MPRSAPPLYCLTLLCAALFLAAPAWAQEPDREPGPPDLDSWDSALGDLDLSGLPEGFGGDQRAAEAWLSLYLDKYVRARELAEALLREDPASIPGHCLIGMVHHRAEGNLPVALYHLKRCRKLFEDRYGGWPDLDAPWFWHALAISETAYVSGEMGRHEDKVRLLLEHDELYQPRRPAERGWPLMRLRRYDAARAAVAEAILLGDERQIVSAKTALCAIEAEEQHREASYEACLEAAAYDREQAMRNPTPFTNAAEAALGLLRMDEAEKLILEATENFDLGVSNPWLDLTLLYLAEGRTGEALDAVRRMFKWRNRQPAYMDEQNRAETEMASAIFLIVAGHAADAARITERALARPDRTGFTSSESEQMEAGAALVDLLANRTAAEMAAERASWSKLTDALAARWESWRLRLRAWSSGRRAAALVTDRRILLATLRPYLAGAVEVPEWIEPELCAAVGPGVVSAALDEARQRETLTGAEGYFRAYETEVAALQGRARDALRLAEEALRTLPESEALLQARVAAIGADAAFDVGERERALALYDRAMQQDPGVIRRLGLALPTAFASAPGPIAELAVDLLRRSPRFTAAPGGFRLQVEGMHDAGEAALLGPHGAVLARVRVTPRAGEETEDVARRLVQELHEAAFAPRLDLTQADIRSLDGSPTAGGGRANERLRNVLSDLVAEGEGGR